MLFRRSYYCNRIPSLKLLSITSTLTTLLLSPLFFSTTTSIPTTNTSTSFFNTQPTTTYTPCLFNHTLRKEKMRIVQVEVLDDNYSYLLIDPATKTTAAIDPAEPSKVIAAAEKENVKISAILTTHHHWDHAQGNGEMLEKLGAMEVYGGDDRINSLSKKLSQDDTFKIGNLTVKVLFTPCHTTGHVLYYVTSPDANVAPALFSGDTVFVGGCGKFFEGTGAQMEAAMQQVRSLPDETEVHCGHEYTLSNLRFALHVDPDNNFLKDKFAWAKEQRRKNLSTVPSTVYEEKKYNPFMRVNSAAIKAAVQMPSSTDSAAIMDALRKLKNNFKPKI